MSSLPEAKKVVSENPPKDSVAAPTVKVDQERDVDRKLRLYGVIKALRNGRMPDNAQLDASLLYARDHSLINAAKLSTDGQKLVVDTQRIIETVRSYRPPHIASRVLTAAFALV